MEILKVSSNTKPASLAGSIAGAIRESGGAKVHAVGAGAVNQAIKGIAITRGFLAPQGIEIYVLPSFMEVFLDGEERTAIVLEVRKL